VALKYTSIQLQFVGLAGLQGLLSFRGCRVAGFRANFNNLTGWSLGLRRCPIIFSTPLVWIDQVILARDYVIPHARAKPHEM